MKNNKTVIIILFFLTSFFGWLIETVGTFIVEGEIVDRGILFLPFCPIYGICVTFIFIVLKAPGMGYLSYLDNKYFLEGNKIKIITLHISYGVLFGLICGVGEYFIGLVIDLFGIDKLWSYESYQDNINGYVRLTYVFLFGLFGFLYMKYIYSKIYQSLIHKNLKMYKLINIVLTIFVLLDIIYQVSKI